jgi:MFS family permease
MTEETAPRFTRATKVLSLTAIATFLVSLDTSIVVVAERTIAADLGNPTWMPWVFSGYSIAYAAGLLTAGRFADVNGRKRSFMRGLALFSIGSVLCGLAPTTHLLVLARLVQAIGGAQLTPASLALVLPEFPAEKRTVAIGVWGAVGGLAAAAGPSLGGVLLDALNWRWLFFINVPFCIFTLIVGRKLLHESKDPNATKNVDLVGTALGFPGVALVTLAIEVVQTPLRRCSQHLWIVFLHRIPRNVVVEHPVDSSDLGLQPSTIWFSNSTWAHHGCIVRCTNGPTCSSLGTRKSSHGGFCVAFIRHIHVDRHHDTNAELSCALLAVDDHHRNWCWLQYVNVV